MARKQGENTMTTDRYRHAMESTRYDGSRLTPRSQPDLDFIDICQSPARQERAGNGVARPKSATSNRIIGG